MTTRQHPLTKEEIQAALATIDGGPGETNPGVVLSPSGLARILGLSPKTIYEWIAKGRLDGAFRKRGKHVLIWRDRAIALLMVAMLTALPRVANWVFVARVTARNPTVGRQISERRLLQYLKRVLKRLSLRGHLHTFRHSFISFAAYEGISERVLRKWIGHVDQQVLDWYFHLADPDSHGTAFAGHGEGEGRTNHRVDFSTISAP